MYEYTWCWTQALFREGKESLVYTDCACVNISRKFSVKLSGHYERTCGSCTYTTVSWEYMETIQTQWRKREQLVFERLWYLFETKKLENNHLVPRKGYSTYIDLPNHWELDLVLVSQSFRLTTDSGILLSFGLGWSALYMTCNWQ